MEFELLVSDSTIKSLPREVDIVEFVLARVLSSALLSLDTFLKPVVALSESVK